MTEYTEAKKSIWTPGAPVFADTPIKKYLLVAAILVLTGLLVLLAAGGRRRLAENRYYSQAVDLQESNQVSAAKKAYKKVLSLNPEHAEANIGLGMLEVGKEPLRAVARYKKAIAIDPGQADYYAWLAYAYFNELGKPAKAIESMKKAIEIDPRNYQYHLAVGIFLSKSGRVEEAIAELEEVIRLEPTVAAAHQKLSRLYAERGRRQAP